MKEFFVLETKDGISSKPELLPKGHGGTELIQRIESSVYNTPTEKEHRDE